MGETKTAFWSAAGVKQELDNINTSMTYVGFGRISGSNEADPLDMPSIFVLNQEFYHKFSPDWKYSFALSYRRQHEYDESFEENKQDAINQEFRFYIRLQYTADLGTVRWTTTLRQEARKFYTDDFAEVPDGLQFRTRLKTQLVVPLDNAGVNSVAGSAEALFAIAKDNSEGWGNFEYKESRFCLYYSLSLKDIPVTFDIGYMNDLIGYASDTYDANYIAMDIIVKDPF
ncbi:DUF2490 domain-containing protein [Flavobacterium album]|nr:DUF2490 domain-containing protein [Flavobacterium album]